MKKLIVLVMCCLVLGGCGSKDIETSAETTAERQTEKETTEQESQPENLYETERLVDKAVGDVKYQIPKSWDDDSKISENNTYYYDDGMMIMVQIQDFAYKSLDSLSTDELNTAKDAVINGMKQGFEKYEEISSDIILVMESKAFRYKANIRISEMDKFMDYLVLVIDGKAYTFGLLVDSECKIDYSEEFESLLESISSTAKEKYSSNTDVINQLKELYKGEAENELSYSQENSDSCFEVVLKSSKELAKSVSGASAEEMVDNILFNPFAIAAGYLCNNHEEDTDYGKVGNMAFDLLGFIASGDNENRDKILNEYDEIAAKYGMTIVTLEETEKKTEESKELQAQEPIELSTGNYIVGEDIPAGKYDIIGIKGGYVRVCSPGKDYGDIVSEAIESNETVYSNVRLKDGYSVEIEMGGKIQLQPK